MKRSNTSSYPGPRPPVTSLALLCSTVALATVGLALMLAFAPRPASANILTDIGRFFGKPLGGFVEAATVPTIRASEASARRIVADVNARVAGRIDQTARAGDQLIATANTAAEQRIAQVDRVAQDRLGQADAIMAARIAQVDASANARIAQTLGGLQSLERQTILDARGTLTQLDATAEQRIEQVNTAAAERISQLHGTVQDAIDDADSAAQARIEQIDEVAERRLGSVDVIATKTSLNLQITLLKVGALLGMIVFLVFAFKYLFEHVPKKLAELREQRPAWGSARRGAMATATSVGWILVHLVAGGIGVAVFGVLANKLPIGAQKQVEAMTAAHQADLQRSYDALDFTRLRYHATQLTILDPGGEPKYRALEARAELIRTAFARPGLLTSANGLRELAQRISYAEAAQRQITGSEGNDPDVQTVQCYLRWQLAASRSDELQAVSWCARALESPAAQPTSSSTAPALRGGASFLLKPIAAQYLRLFLARTPPEFRGSDPPPYTLAALERLAAHSAQDREQFGLLGAALIYDQLVLELDRKASTAYVAMLEAHADLERAQAKLGPKRKPQAARGPSATPAEPERAVLEAKRARLAHAREVIAAFSEFDRQLQSTVEAIDGSLALSSLTLNDAPLTQALWFEAMPDAVALPPSVQDEPQLELRVAMAPIRIAWARRYLALLSPQIQQLAGHEEAERFMRDERATRSFAQAYVTYRRALANATASGELTTLRDQAARAAGEMNLYAGSDAQAPRAFGVTLLHATAAGAPSAGVIDAVQAAYAGNRLRLL